MVAARFQRDISGCAARRFTGRTQCMNFCMRLTSTHMPTFCDEPAVAYQHATDTRIRTCRPQPPLCKMQCLSHPLTVGSIHFLSFWRRRVFLTASIASEKSPTS